MTIPTIQKAISGDFMSARAGAIIRRSAPISSSAAASPPMIEMTRIMSNSSRVATTDALNTVSIAPSGDPVTVHPTKKAPIMHGMSASRRFAIVITTITTKKA